MLVSASIFSAKGGRSNAELVREMENAGVDCIHFDFTRERAPDYKELAEIRATSRLCFDAHYTSPEALDHLERMQETGFDRYAIEAEEIEDIRKLDRPFRDQFTMNVGLAFEVVSEPERYIPLLVNYDYALIMATKAGVSGMPFQTKAYDVIREVKKRYPHLPIAVDGGVTGEVLGPLQKFGVDMVVSGSGLLNATSIKSGLAGLHQMKSLARMKECLIPTKRAPVIRAQESIQEVLEKITTYKQGGCVVLNNDGTLFGLIVDGDIRRAIQKHGEKIFHMTAGQLANPSPLTLHWGTPPQEILEKLNSVHHTLSIIPVLDAKDRVLGVTSSQALVRGR